MAARERPGSSRIAITSFRTNKIGVWGLRPQRVQGRALAFHPYGATENTTPRATDPPEYVVP